MTDYVRRVRELQVPPIPKLIFYALATRADAKGICWPSIRTLCHDTGLARRTVQIHLQQIIQDRLVFCEARSGQASVYRLNVEAWPSTTCARARDAPAHNARPGSAAPASPSRTTCAGDAHDMPITSARPAPEVTKKYPLKFPLKLSTKLRPTESPTESSRREREQPRVSPWWTSEAGITRRGVELGIKPRVGESYPDYKSRLFAIEQERQRAPERGRLECEHLGKLAGQGGP